MGPPVRVVCRACLQSVDRSSEGASDPFPSCPFCGTPVESARYDPEFPTTDHTPTTAPTSRSDFPTLWTESDADSSPRSTRIGRFQIVEPLGEGGYGQVYRAYDPRLDRDVALKVLKTTRLDEKAIQRFYREARAAARLDHPNIVGLYDAGRDDGRCWIAYQLISGRTLSHIRDIHQPSIPESVRIVRDLALALDHAHSRGVFHRDLKPANVMIDDSGRTRLTDFGLARRGDLDSDLTIEGTVLGTPHYMSPEAAAGRSNRADARSDVYSLGVILYELICGRKPADLPTNSPPWRFKPNPLPPSPRSVARAVPAGLDRICMKALAFDPADRYLDAETFAEALAPYAGAGPARRGASGEHGPGRAGATPSPCASRNRPLLIGAGFALPVLVLGLALLFRPWSTPAGGQGSGAAASRTGAAVVDPGTAPTLAPRPPSSLPSGAGNLPETSPPVSQPADADQSGEETAPGKPVVGNKNKKTFHRPGCPALSNAFESHKKTFTDARAALADHYTPCGRCKPTQPIAPPGIDDED